MNTKICVLVALALVASVSADATYSPISCSAAKTDATCNPTGTAVAGPQCCATITTATKATAAATTTTNTTSYFCLPVDFVKNVGSVASTNLVSYYYACGTTTQTEATTCAKNADCDTTTSCCTAQSATVTSVAPTGTFGNKCVKNDLAGVSTFSGTGPTNAVYTRTCMSASSNGQLLSAVMGIIASIAVTFTFF